MKNLLLTIIVLCLTQVLMAQTTAAEYMKRAPEIPANVCKAKGSTEVAFSEALQNLSYAIREDVRNRQKEAEQFMQGQEELIKASMIKKSGIPDEDIKRLQSGEEMTDAETNAMVDKMMQQKTNISFEDAQNLSKMSEAEQQAWAETYAAGKITKVQTNPDQILGENETIRSSYELLAEQTALMNKIIELESQLNQKLMVIDQDAKAARIEMEKALKPLYEELNSINDGEGSTQEDIDHAARVLSKIHEKQDAYCEIFTPRVLEFIRESKEAFVQALPDYDKIEKIQADVIATQTGTEPMTAGKGMNSLKAVDQYLRFLAKAFSYKLYRME